MRLVATRAAPPRRPHQAQPIDEQPGEDDPGRRRDDSCVAPVRCSRPPGVARRTTGAADHSVRSPIARTTATNAAGRLAAIAGVEGALRRPTDPDRERPSCGGIHQPLNPPATSCDGPSAGGRHRRPRWVVTLADDQPATVRATPTVIVRLSRRCRSPSLWDRHRRPAAGRGVAAGENDAVDVQPATAALPATVTVPAAAGAAPQVVVRGRRRRTRRDRSADPYRHRRHRRRRGRHGTRCRRNGIEVAAMLPTSADRRRHHHGVGEAAVRSFVRRGDLDPQRTRTEPRGTATGSTFRRRPVAERARRRPGRPGQPHGGTSE